MIARRLSTVRRVLVASPRYLSTAGTPLMPADLAVHRAIVTSRAPDVWYLADNWHCEVRWAIAAGNMLVTHELARLDQGIALLPDFLVRDDLRSGAPVTVLNDHADDRATAWIVTSPQLYRSAAVKAVIEHIAGEPEE
ncbi:LysR substrate-binding domain-containing protein [Sphingomonas sp. NFX23]|uniref:LysR substrate-binding domain-containing protein n=1 Tax=Sphingomonas sp. NFX23 TaxID=2819532 RepID=UPI003CF4F4EB